MPSCRRTPSAPSCSWAGASPSDDMVRWNKILFRKGAGAPRIWPKSFGGAGWDIVQQHIFEEERADACAPGQNPFSRRCSRPRRRLSAMPRSRDYFLLCIFSGEDWWCQGYSEPGSGSDLASAAPPRRTPGRSVYRQRPENLEYPGPVRGLDLLSAAHQQRRPSTTGGILFLLIDMKSPFISVRPIIMLDGEHENSHIFLDNVKVPGLSRCRRKCR